MNDQIPEPTFASVRVEYADGTSREFHIRKPLRVEVDIPIPHWPHDLNADLGAVPPGIVPPVLPRLEVRMQAGVDAGRQVITVDSRTEDPAAFTGRLLALLGEAFDLRKAGADNEQWSGWEGSAGMVLRGELQR